jgi:hypothetical protein
MLCHTLSMQSYGLKPCVFRDVSGIALSFPYIIHNRIY